MLRSSKVHRPHNHGPRVAEALLAAVLLGIALNLSAPITQFHWGFAYFPNVFWGFAPTLVLLLFLGILHPNCRHQKWRFLIGAMVGSALFLATVVFDPFDKIRFSVARLFIESLIVTPIAGTIGGLLNIGLAALKDRLGERPKTQDGTLCPTCGYTILGLPEPRCPECGSRFTPQDLEASSPSCKRQWRRVGVASLATSFLLVGAYLTGPYVVIRGWTGGWLQFGGALEFLRINPKLSERLLCDGLETGNDTERFLGACQLGFLLMQSAERGTPDDRTLNLLVQAAIEDPLIKVRRMAIQSLSFLDTDVLYDLLPLALRDESADVRWSALANAARGGVMPDPRGTPFLIQALDDPDQTVRTNVYSRLQSNTGQSFPFNPTAPIEQRRAEQEKWQQWWVSQQ